MDIELAPPSLALPRAKTPASISVTRPIGTVVCLCVSDCASVLLSLVIGALIHTTLIGPLTTPVTHVFTPALALTLCCFTAARLYPGIPENPVNEIRQSVRAVILGFLFLWSATYFFRDLTQSRLVFFLASLVSAVLVPSSRALFRSMFADQPWWGCPVAILGFGETGKRIHSTLSKNPRAGMKVVAVLDDNPAEYSNVNPSLVRGPLSRCLEISREQRISYAIVCMPELSRSDLLRLLDQYGHCFGHVMVVPDLIGMASLSVAAREMGGVIGLEVTRQLLRPSAQITKRALDLSISILLAPILAPILLVIAALIKCETPGPVLYGNRRVGREGKTFTAWKFRSMVVDGSDLLDSYLNANPHEQYFWTQTQKLRCDPRVTRIGRLIRKLSIDEIPQIWNVFRGEMSLVGPRPCLEHQVEMYGPNFELYKMVRPGITGLWQVSGRNKLTFAERVELDAYVIQNWSVWMDIYILARTISVVFTANGAY